MPASIHLVIPCYHESGRIAPFLAELCETLTPLGGITIRVVEDGSDEDEKKRMSTLIDAQRTQTPLLLEPLFLPQNLGKGGAIYASWNAEKSADWLAFVDADGSCTAAEVAQWMGQKGFQPLDLFFPEVNVRLGTRYLAYLHGLFDGNAMLAVGAYNGGPNAMKRWLAQSPNWRQDPDLFVESIPYGEARDYIKKVFTSYWNYRQLYAAKE